MSRSVSKKIRFSVFKRDGFQCQYCGQTPPSVVLECDHIVAVAAGGLDEIDNLTTACFDCNRGKGAGDLRVAPSTIAEKSERLKEQEMQLKEYSKVLEKRHKKEDLVVDKIEVVFQRIASDFLFNDVFRRNIKRQFMPHLMELELIDAMEIATDRFPDDRDRVIRYFCGVCWRMIKEKNA